MICHCVTDILFPIQTECKINIFSSSHTIKYNNFNFFLQIFHLKLHEPLLLNRLSGRSFSGNSIKDSDRSKHIKLLKNSFYTVNDIATIGGLYSNYLIASSAALPCNQVANRAASFAE